LPTFYVNNAANISINRRKNAVIVLFFHRNGMAVMLLGFLLRVDHYAISYDVSLSDGYRTYS
jgi:hypothetical protein